MESSKLFLAIDMTAVEKQALRCITHELRAQFKGGCEYDGDMYHITLHVFEDATEDRIGAVKRAMKKAASVQTPFTVVTGSPGMFGSPESAIVWIDMHEGQPVLEKLHADLEKLILKEGFSEEAIPYHPHITLGRGIDTRAFEPPMGEMLLPSVNLSANALTLLEFRSEGGRVVFEPKAKVEFKGK